MIRWLVVSVVVVTASDARAECTGTLDGHVVDAATHEVVAGATVTAGDWTGLTDDAGRFLIAKLCQGEITVAVERADYDPVTRRIAVAGKAAVEIAVTARATERIEIRGKAPPPPELRSTTVLSGDALERQRGKSLSDSLAEIPGVSELKSATGMAKPIIRGQFGRRLLVLVDSVRHRSQDWGLDHAPEIDPFIAGSIAVVRGAGGVRYGSDAIGGVVLVEPPELRTIPGANGEVHLIGTSNGRGGTLAARLQAVSARVPDLSLQVEGSAKRLAAPETPAYPLDNAGVFEWSAGATVGYHRGNGDYKLSYRRYQATLGVCTCLRIENAEEFFSQIQNREPVNSDLYRADFEIERPSQHVAHDTAIARAAWSLEHVGKLTTTYSFQYDLRRELDIVRDAIQGAQFNFHLMTHELEAVLEHAPIHLSDHWHLRGFGGLVGMGQVNDYNGLNLIPDHRSLGVGVYAGERLVGHATEVEAGLRYDLLARSAELIRRDFTRLVRSGQLGEDACGPGEPDPVTCRSRFRTLTATAGLLRRFGDAWSGKLELSTAARAPNPDEQFLNGTAPTFPVLGLGKPDLKPETTYSTSATLGYTSGRVTAEASAYVNRIDNYIYFAPAIDDTGTPIFDVLINGAFPRFTTQAVDALFYGADGGIAVIPHPALELGAQVSLVRAENRDTGGFLVFVPPDRYRGSLTYHPPAIASLRKSFATVSGTYVTHQRRFDIAADFMEPPPAYFLLGAELGAETTLHDQTVKVALQGSNLTNARYRDYTSLLKYFADEPGWQVWLRVSLFFDSHKQGK
ncbi:MAG: TonB-dependent receptor [Kofleriaceae bacterium]